MTNLYFFYKFFLKERSETKLSFFQVFKKAIHASSSSDVEIVSPEAPRHCRVSGLPELHFTYQPR